MTKENEGVFENNEIDIMTAANGDGNTLFLRGLKEIMENSYDELTPDSKPREVNIGFVVTPIIDPMIGGHKHDRITGFAISAKSSTKLCKAQSNSHVTYVQFDSEGFPVVMEKDPKQMNMFNQRMQKQKELELEEES